MFAGAVIVSATSCEKNSAYMLAKKKVGKKTHEDRGGVEERLVVVEKSRDHSMEDGLSEDGETLVVDAGSEETLSSGSVRGIGEDLSSGSTVNRRERRKRHSNRSQQPSWTAARL
jgi:hypothetical protein